MTTADALDQGRESYGRQAWADAFDQLSAADREAPLDAHREGREEGRARVGLGKLAGLEHDRGHGVAGR